MSENDRNEEFYFDFFLKQFPTPNIELKKFTRSFLILERYKKKEFVYTSGEIQKEVGFVCQGLLRKYYVNQKGSEIITGFIREYGYATDYPAFLTQKPSKYYIQCLEPTIIVKMPYEKLQVAYKKYRENEMFGRLVAENVLIRETNRVESLLFDSAEQRYLNFIAKNKEMINRISLTHLASYLGIERQSLSRIRSKLAKK